MTTDYVCYSKLAILVKSSCAVTNVKRRKIPDFRKPIPTYLNRFDKTWLIVHIATINCWCMSLPAIKEFGASSLHAKRIPTKWVIETLVPSGRMTMSRCRKILHYCMYKTTSNMFSMGEPIIGVDRLWYFAIEIIIPRYINYWIKVYRLVLVMIIAKTDALG